MSSLRVFNRRATFSTLPSPSRSRGFSPICSLAHFSIRLTYSVLSSPSPDLIGGLTGRSSNHRPWILDCPVKPGNDTRRINLTVKCSTAVSPVSSRGRPRLLGRRFFRDRRRRLVATLDRGQPTADELIASCALAGLVRHDHAALTAGLRREVDRLRLTECTHNFAFGHIEADAARRRRRRAGARALPINQICRSDRSDWRYRVSVRVRSGREKGRTIRQPEICRIRNHILDRAAGGNAGRKSDDRRAARQHPSTANPLRNHTHSKPPASRLGRPPQYSVSAIRTILASVGRVCFNPPSRQEWRVKANPR